MKQPESHILVIFGASGDLTKRKLIPALYELHTQELLPEKLAVVGVFQNETNRSGISRKHERVFAQPATHKKRH